MPEVQLDFRVPDILPPTLPVVALRRGILLPGGVQGFGIGRAISRSALDHTKDGLVLVAVQRERVADPVPSDLLPVAVLARVLDRPDEKRVLVQGLTRVTLTGFPASRPHLEASFKVLEAGWPDTPEAEALARTFRGTARETAELVAGDRPTPPLLDIIQDHGLLADATAMLLEAPEAWKRDVLQTSDPVVRVEKVLQRLVRVKEVISAQKSIQSRLESDAKDQQKEVLLRRQLKAIQEELGEGDDDELTRIREKLDEAALPDEVRETVDRELRRLERLNAASPERSVAVDWLEWIAELPWGTHSAVDVDLKALEQALDRSHHGLEEVKRQVIEHLAVRKLAGAGRADVLLLVGPPGVGKTSIGQAIADATGRKLVRVALGGARDEAALRGHRRTYIGARPGRLIEGIRRAGTADPVILLDELDKVGADWRGDPSAALLEILDPEQNHAFTDNYLDVPFDLSKALFIATANDLTPIRGPLRDRLEVLEIAGYTPEEKLTIARGHLLDRLAENAGLEPDDVEITDDAIARVIDGWTREAGVRQLQRVLGKVYRGAAVHKARDELTPPLVVDADDLETWLKRPRFTHEDHEVPTQAGIATGLAWTPVGGSVLYVEASTLPGSGRLILTGQLGDVMKESARAALTYVLAHAETLGFPLDAAEAKDVHVHVPAGAVPKDGPSAGVTMFTALASLFSGRLVKEGVAMTGEATLRGRVLPVGGIKSKVLAAHRNGCHTVILPRRNERDLEDLPLETREAMRFVLVDHVSEVLEEALAVRKSDAAATPGRAVA
ncbi:MAG: endopeptidase La [Alphaproteobacteria bacterium]|nr:endopeptidase La [Alphaproteobacteria bacterium]